MAFVNMNNKSLWPGCNSLKLTFCYVQRVGALDVDKQIVEKQYLKKYTKTHKEHNLVWVQITILLIQSAVIANAVLRQLSNQHDKRNIRL